MSQCGLEVQREAWPSPLCFAHDVTGEVDLSTHRQDWLADTIDGEDLSQ